ncbi:hypothetical protein DFH07DRAFT_943091 [Mycena maculata]|uniref:Uncharacterized protein n=1 Tax=Mycena maculata TaxID=230809 RepID=A0AAD7N3K0_9AGAR|nr:hypothetical protein DFH07DRAFT_943091 [Mycena maculata]
MKTAIEFATSTYPSIHFDPAFEPNLPPSAYYDQPEDGHKTQKRILASQNAVSQPQRAAAHSLPSTHPYNTTYQTKPNGSASSPPVGLELFVLGALDQRVSSSSKISLLIAGPLLLPSLSHSPSLTSALDIPSSYSRCQHGTEINKPPSLPIPRKPIRVVRARDHRLGGIALVPPSTLPTYPTLPYPPHSHGIVPPAKCNSTGDSLPPPLVDLPALASGDNVVLITPNPVSDFHPFISTVPIRYNASESAADRLARKEERRKLKAGLRGVRVRRWEWYRFRRAVFAEAEIRVARRPPSARGVRLRASVMPRHPHQENLKFYEERGPSWWTMIV